MKRKVTLLLFMLTAFALLTGWGKKEVRLLDSSKLIDLSKAIELAKPGGSAGDSEEPSESEESGEEGKVSGNSSQELQESLSPAYQRIVIRIRGEQIFYTHGRYSQDDISAAGLESALRSDYVPGREVILMDDFAEAHVYKEVCGVLDELKSSIGLAYKEDMAAGGE
ncbi:MAG: hypothetical protein J6O71_03260 [Lachnospiraceae bacterium]|nr:hypothetical protein [Lachnospiraceae bacterium]